MSRTRKTSLLLLTLLAVGIVALALKRPAEPVFQGEPITVWLADNLHSYYYSGRVQDIIPANPMSREEAKALVDLANAPAESAQFQRLKKLVQRPREQSFRDRVAGLIKDPLNQQAFDLQPAQVKDFVFSTLMIVRPEGDLIVPFLEPDLASADSGRRCFAYETLGKIRHRADATAPALIEGLRREDELNRLIVIQSILKLRLATPPVIAELITAIDKIGPDYRSLVVETITSTIPVHENVMPLLLHLLVTEKSPQTRSAIARRMMLINPAQPEALEALAQLANNP